MLSLDGQLIRILSLRISGLVKEHQDQDMSGQTSSTDVSEQGDKPAKINFSGLIPFRDPDTRKMIYNLFSKKNEKGEKHVYRLGYQDAAELKIRNVRFTGKLRLAEHETLQAWEVTFVLKEHLSVAEQKEKRNKAKNQPEQNRNTQLQQALAEAEEAIK